MAGNELFQTYSSSLIKLTCAKLDFLLLLVGEFIPKILILLFKYGSKFIDCAPSTLVRQFKCNSGRLSIHAVITCYRFW